MISSRPGQPLPWCPLASGNVSPLQVSRHPVRRSGRGERGAPGARRQAQAAWCGPRAAPVRRRLLPPRRLRVAGSSCRRTGSSTSPHCAPRCPRCANADAERRLATGAGGPCALAPPRSSAGPGAAGRRPRDVPAWCGRADERTGPRVAIYAPPGPHYVEATWGTWLAGGIAVPLCLTHPPKRARGPPGPRFPPVLRELTTPACPSRLRRLSLPATPPGPGAHSASPVGRTRVSLTLS